mmetsp:Transcript_39872/g.132932  ORF Transcript_39872/g.132932 Transcript_39872/m.132932 type:complete len:219 (+) Transcript_39872:515-1171(+)
MVSGAARRRACCRSGELRQERPRAGTRKESPPPLRHASASAAETEAAAGVSSGLSVTWLTTRTATSKASESWRRRAARRRSWRERSYAAAAREPPSSSEVRKSPATESITTSRTCFVLSHSVSLSVCQRASAEWSCITCTNDMSSPDVAPSAACLAAKECDSSSSRFMGARYEGVSACRKTAPPPSPPMAGGSCACSMHCSTSCVLPVPAAPAISVRP